MLIAELKNRQHLLSYFRKEDRTPIGVVLAIYNQKTNTVTYGWSKCGQDKAGKLKDNFSTQRGQFIALKRAENSGLKNIPIEMSDFILNFIKESKTYFAPRPPKFEDNLTVKQ